MDMVKKGKQLLLVLVDKESAALVDKVSAALVDKESAAGKDSTYM